LLIILLALITSVAAEQRKEISPWVARDVAPGPKVRITLNTRNIPSVRISAYRIPDTTILLRRRKIEKRPELPAKPVMQWDVSLVSKNETGNPA